MNTNREISEMLDKLIKESRIVIDPVIQLDGEIYFPGIHRYYWDDEGHPHQVKD